MHSVQLQLTTDCLDFTFCLILIYNFSDDYESIRQHMRRYIATGSTTTPSHGRGQRTSKKTIRYESEEESEMEVAKVIYVIHQVKV